MGIRHLRRHLEPYAQRFLLNHKKVVIDGPSLAYHIIHLCSNRSKNDSPFEQPSYKLLGNTVIAWLDQLRGCGIDILAIYFDGFLPEAKIPERLQRFYKLSKELRVYAAQRVSGLQNLSDSPRSSYSRYSTDSQVTKGIAAGVELFPTRGCQSGQKSPPIPPFSVSAIIEALKSSPTYTNVVEIVPAEAEVFCARRARAEGGSIVVLSSDSDLLVHPLGVNSGTIFFDDLELVTEPEHTLTGLQYQAFHICQRLSLNPSDGITRFAFELSRDDHITFHEAVQKSRAAAFSQQPEEEEEEEHDEYAKFTAQYSHPEIGQQNSAAREFILDPRVSEAVLRLFTTNKNPAVAICNPSPPMTHDTARPIVTVSPSSAGNDSGPPDAYQCPNEIRMFLLHLLDSPARTSAWEPSTRFRRLAYSLLLLATESPEKITSAVEFRRLQSPSHGGTRVDILLSPEDVGSECAELLNVIITIKKSITSTDSANNNNNSNDAWVVLAVYQEIVTAASKSQTQPLSVKILRDEARGTGAGALDQTSWDYAHFVAQLQGSYYSLRMLRQVLQFAVAVAVARSRLPAAAADLLDALLLLPLPPLADLPAFGDFAALLRRVRQARGFACLGTASACSLPLPENVAAQVRALVGDAPTTPEGEVWVRFEPPNAPRKARVGRRPAYSGLSPLPSSSSRNRFGALAEDSD